MSVSLASLTELVKLNLSTEQMAGVIKIMVSELEPIEDMRLEQERLKSLRRDRNNRYTTNKRLNGVLQDETKTQKVSSPLSPSFSPIPPITTPNPPTSKITLSASADFDDFWLVYPKRAGNVDKASASKAFFAALKRASVSEIIEGAKAYADFCSQTGKLKTEFVRQARTWLNANGWNEKYEIGIIANSHKPNTIAHSSQVLDDTIAARARELDALIELEEAGQGHAGLLS